jgi:hypothetical protein
MLYKGLKPSFIHTALTAYFSTYACVILVCHWWVLSCCWLLVLWQVMLYAGSVQWWNYDCRGEKPNILRLVRGQMPLFCHDFQLTRNCSCVSAVRIRRLSVLAIVYLKFIMCWLLLRRSLLFLYRCVSRRITQHFLIRDFERNGRVSGNVTGLSVTKETNKVTLLENKHQCSMGGAELKKSGVSRRNATCFVFCECVIVWLTQVHNCNNLHPQQSG